VAELELGNVRMHDLPKQDVVHLLPLPPLPQQPTPIFRIPRSGSWCLRNRLGIRNLHADVLI
jgi:hypothetical protein